MTMYDKISNLMERALRLERANQNADELGLGSVTKAHFLNLCVSTEGGMFTMAWVRETTGMSPSGASVLMSKLESFGLVKEIRIDGLKGKYKAFSIENP